MKKVKSGKRVFCLRLKGRQKFLRLLGDKDKDYGLRSGLVTLKPKEFIGEHKTEKKEEVIIVLKGRAIVYYGKRNKIKAATNNFIYIPAETAHNVGNSGSKILQYVYVTAKVA